MLRRVREESRNTRYIATSYVRQGRTGDGARQPGCGVMGTPTSQNKPHHLYDATTLRDEELGRRGRGLHRITRRRYSIASLCAPERHLGSGYHCWKVAFLFFRVLTSPRLESQCRLGMQSGTEAPLLPPYLIMLGQAVWRGRTPPLLARTGAAPAPRPSGLFNQILFASTEARTR